MRIPVVYIAGKYRAETPEGVELNIRAAEDYASIVATLGAFPMATHCVTRNIGDSQDEPFWLAATLEVMRRCDVVLMLPGWEESFGSRGELKEARLLGITVVHSLSALADYLRHPRARPLVNIVRKVVAA